MLAQFEHTVLAAVPLTVVEDRDRVVASEQIATELARRGADLVSYDDPVAFRYLLEKRYRDDQTSPYLVVRADDLTKLPWDILHAAERHGRRLVVTLAGLFPSLQADLLPQLDRRHLDRISSALTKYEPRPGRDGTIDYLLEHVFRIVPSTLADEGALLSALIELHYTDEVLPDAASDRLASILADVDLFDAWPIKPLLRSAASLWSFLEDRWSHYVNHRTGSNVSGLPDVADPVVLPFDDPRVHVRMDNLFLEGFLEPTNVVTPAAAAQHGIVFGVGSQTTEPVERLRELTRHLDDAVPASTADHYAWQRFARTWGEWTAARIAVHNLGETDLAEPVMDLQTRVQTTFESWMVERFAGLTSLPYWPAPPMLHHIPDFLTHGRVSGQGVNRRVALIVMDGMGFAQWHEVRPYVDALHAQVEESGTFAWVPTLTVVSRQAVFAGEAPYAYATSINTTRKEPRHWQRFWTEKGLRPESIKYVHAQKLGSGDAMVKEFTDVLEHPATRVVGGVIGTIDQLAHAAKTGASGFHAALRDWLEQDVLGRILRALLDADYDVYLTSDHGNVEIRGNGRPNTGSIATTNGERARVFSSEALRDAVHDEMPGGIVWHPHGLPTDYYPVLAPWDSAFVSKKFELVSHGGITVDEVIVPFVSIRRDP